MQQIRPDRRKQAIGAREGDTLQSRRPRLMIPGKHAFLQTRATGIYLLATMRGDMGLTEPANVLIFFVFSSFVGYSSKMLAEFARSLSNAHALEFLDVKIGVGLVGLLDGQHAVEVEASEALAGGGGEARVESRVAVAALDALAQVIAPAQGAVDADVAARGRDVATVGRLLVVAAGDLPPALVVAAVGVDVGVARVLLAHVVDADHGDALEAGEGQQQVEARRQGEVAAARPAGHHGLHLEAHVADGPREGRRLLGGSVPAVDA